MGLIKELHGQHGEIRTHLRKLVGSEDMELMDFHLKQLKGTLIDHLINEDNHLYPALRSLKATKKISDSYEEEMGEISSDIMDFYSLHQDGNNRGTYIEDTNEVVQRLIYRIAKEEKELYPTFQKYFPNR